MTNPDKNQLRALLRKRRRSLSRQQQVAAMRASNQLACLLPQWPSAQRIAIYHPVDGEMGTEIIAQRCHDEGREVYLPVIHRDMTMDFALTRAGDSLPKNKLGICEPGAKAVRCPAANLDIVFMPLLAWDKTGNRLGMGAGYYDRVLEGVSGPLLVGLAHEIQQLDSLPRDSWDVPLHKIITDRRTYHCQN